MIDWWKLVVKNGEEVIRLNGVMLNPLMEREIHGNALKQKNLQKNPQREKQSTGAITWTCVLENEFYK